MPDRTLANENPWYVLAKIHGEQDGYGIDRDRHAENRNTWNRYFVWALEEEQRDALKARVDPYDLIPLSEPERDDLEAKMERKGQSLPDPREPVSFKGIEVPHHLVLSRLLFPNNAYFREAAFLGRVDFREAVFLGDANFREAAFQGYAVFMEAAFQVDADFSQAEFRGNAFFRDAAFQGEANFSEAAFQGNAIFRETAFEGDAFFLGAAKVGMGGGRGACPISGRIDAESDGHGGSFSATLGAPDGVPSSARREFGKLAFFEGASFSKVALFVNRVFLSTTSFNRARFLAHPPQFADAELHQGTTWRGTVWPGLPSIRDADDHIDAYRQLRLRMNEIQDHDLELDFFARELAAKRVKAGWSFAGIVILLYQFLSDCGRSVGRPIAAFGGLIGVFGPVFHGPLTASGKVEGLWAAYGFAAASLTGLLGTRREFFFEVTRDLPGWAQALSGGWSLVGAVLVFLMALAVRNRFRIR